MNTSATPPLSGSDGNAGLSRALSPAERWYWIINQLATANVCARVRIEGELSTEELRAALGALRTRHPLLRLAIATEPDGTGPRFVPTDNPVPLRVVSLARPDDSRWVRELDDHEFPHPIDWRSGPLARGVLVSQPGQVHDLIITVPHYIADGTTVLALLRQWVRLAAGQQVPGRTVANGPVTPPAEDLFPARYRVVPGEAQAGGESDDDQDGVAGRVEPDRFVPFDRRRTRLLHRVLDGDTLENLRLACKREGATLHGLLAAAMACAVARDAGAPSGAPFAVGTPVGFRNELEPPVSEEEVGCYVSAIRSEVPYQPDDLWSMARFVNRDIARRRQRGEQYPVFSLLANQGPAGVADSEPLVRYIEEHGSFNFYVSSIGRFDFPDTVGTWQLSGAQFTGDISVVGYFASAITTSHGQLSWNFTYVDEAISRERAERLVEDSIATVLEAAAG